MTGKTFTAQLQDIEDLTNADLLEATQNAITDVVVGTQTTQIGITQGATSFVEGKIPVGLTAELVNSLSVDGGAASEDAYVVAIAGMEIGDSLDFKWGADHALPMETGFTIEKADGTTVHVPGRFYVTRNAEQFSEHVEKRVAEVRR